MQRLINILIALLIFGIVVAIHEFGHFIFAKLNKVKVHEFSIGMGPLLFQKKKKETNYSLRAIPMGGYVSMEGEDEESDDPDSFSQKSPLRRMSIVFAGPFMNFVLTIILFIFIFTVNGVPVNKVGIVMQNSPAQKAQIQQGDVIKEINGIKIEKWSDVPETINSTKGEVKLEILRDGKMQSVYVVPDERDGKRTIGIYQGTERNFAKAVPFAFTHTYDITKMMLDFIAKLFTGKVDFSYVSGPVGIVREVGNSVQYGFMTVLNYIAFISLNLGIMNLLPIPALDGFRLVTAFCELVTGKKLKKKSEYMVNLAGMVLLISLMLFVTYKDVLKIIK